MDYMDEEIVKLRQKMKESSSDIHTGYFIDSSLVEFEETFLFDKQMSIYLPKDFVNMPLKIAKVKYPSEQRPQIIKTNLLGTINFGFNLFEKPIKPGQIESAAESMKAMLKKVNPANIFYKQSCEPLGSSYLCWFDFKGYGIDTQIYYIVYITSIGGNLHHGVFNCAYEDSEKWKNAAMQVMHSITDLTEEKQNA